jgi:hypothetical protein
MHFTALIGRERMMDEIEQFAEELAVHVMATGRDPREILQSMRDEGYIDCDDEGFEECIRRAVEKTRD